MFRYGKLIFLIAVAAVVATFLYISNGLVRDLAAQERERMEIWADATKEIISVSSIDHDTAPSVDIDFLLRIIERNTTIPVLLTDDNGSIMQQRNFSDMPDALNPDNPLELSQANEVYLQKKLENLRQSSNVIDIEIAPGEALHLYYEDSTLLKRLNYFPYIQLLVMLAFIVVVYFAVLSSKKAEQNKVWVGLSKETAHQLGTPISSLMAWTEYLSSTGTDKDITDEIDKDVKRLSTIADRFSKIGSRPEMQLEYINETIEQSLDYMRHRVSGRVEIVMHLSDDDHGVRLSRPLLEWVMENLTKNAVDAMQGAGRIDISTGCDRNTVWIEVRDTGKGIPRKHFKTIFRPGYTTKKRGWGLGLTLVKRIIEEYHGGKIFVKDSEIGKGTVFRIELPAYR